jgi:pimeloyl-ACP methyl ester carboxylesterase
VTVADRTVARSRTALVRALLALILLGLVAVLPAAFIAPTTSAPVFWQNWAFDVRLLAGLPIKPVLSLLNGPLAAKQLYWDTYGETVAVESAGLTLAGTLYTPPQSATASYPGIVLLHGSTPVGRKMGLYRILGRELADRGYLVLALDLRGYGGSDDVTHAVDYLTTIAEIRQDQLFVVGHSFGGDVAISAAVAEPRLQKVVAIGPGRRFNERGGTPEAPEFNYFRRREMRYMLLREAIPAETFMAYRVLLPLENQMAYFTRAHQPLLLIDGALESAADRAFLQNVYNLLSEPKAYMTLADADHYVNTANLGPVVIYDQLAVEALVQEIDKWLVE